MYSFYEFLRFDRIRDKTLELVKEENRPRYESLKWYIEIIGLDFSRRNTYGRVRYITNQPNPKTLLVCNLRESGSRRNHRLSLKNPRNHSALFRAICEKLIRINILFSSFLILYFNLSICILYFNIES